MYFVLIAILFGFPIFWMFISFLVSRLGGWARLARHYPERYGTENDYDHERSMCAGSIGMSSYKSVLKLRTSDRGLHVSVLFLFRFGHPPLFIPWDQFYNVTERKVLFVHSIRAQIGSPVVANVVLPVWVKDHMPGS